MKHLINKAHKHFFPSSKNGFKPHIFKPKNLFILLIILLVLKFLIFSYSFYFSKTSDFAIVTSSELIELANQEREKIGISPLSINQKLVEAAQQKAQDMIDKGYFAHTSPDGLVPWYWLEKTDYKYSAAGENLARNFTDSEYLHQGWMDSLSHRLNILNKNFREIGIAVVEGEINGKKTTIAVEFFGKPLSPKSVVKVSQEATPVKKSETKIVVPIVAVDISSGSEDVASVSVPSQELASNIKGEGTSDISNSEAEKQKFFIDESDYLVRTIYFIILAVLLSVLMLTIFVNFRVQHPKLLFIAIIFILIIFGITCFNGQELLNKGIQII